MNINNRGRGISLVFTLFTILLLCSMAQSVIAGVQIVENSKQDGDSVVNTNIQYLSETVGELDATTIETVIDQTNVTKGLPKLKTKDLPVTEKNRINQSQEWYYHDRGLKQPPLDWHIDTPILDKDEIYSVAFGLIEGMTVTINLDVEQFYNDSFIPTDYRGDLDLMLYKDGNAIPLGTSTNDEGSDENLIYTSVEEANFTLKILHDSRDSTHPNGSGYLELTSELYSNYFAYSYFEGRNATNQPTDYSTWFFYSGQNLHTFGVTVDDTIDFYQLRAIIDGSYGDLSTDAQTWGVDMAFVSIYDYYHKVEIEAEWGSGFALIAALDTTSYVDQLMTSQRSFPIGLDLSEVYIQLARASYSEETSWLANFRIDGSTRLGIFNISLQTYLDNFVNYIELNEYTISNYDNPGFLISGIRGPSQLGVHQFYTKVADIAGANAKITLHYSTDNTVFTELPLQWVVDEYYGGALSLPDAPENIYWYVTVEQDFPSELNPPTSPNNVIADFDLYYNDIDLDWTAPTDNGGLPLIGYYVFEKSSTMQYWTVYQIEPDTTYWSSNLPYVAEGIPNWKYGVVAYNSIGNSTMETVESSYNLPGSISNLNGSYNVQDQTVEITWDPPTEQGNPSFDSYSIFISQTEDIEDYVYSTSTGSNYYSDWDTYNYDGNSVYYFIAANNYFGAGEYEMVKVNLFEGTDPLENVETTVDYPLISLIILPIVTTLKKLHNSSKPKLGKN